MWSQTLFPLIHLLWPFFSPNCISFLSLMIQLLLTAQQPYCFQWMIWYLTAVYASLPLLLNCKFQKFYFLGCFLFFLTVVLSTPSIVPGCGGLTDAIQNQWIWIHDSKCQTQKKSICWAWFRAAMKSCQILGALVSKLEEARAAQKL